MVVKLSAHEKFELSVVLFAVVFHRHTFPPVFFIAAHMLCPLCTSQQELLLQLLTV